MTSKQRAMLRSMANTMETMSLHWQGGRDPRHGEGGLRRARGARAHQVRRPAGCAPERQGSPRDPLCASRRRARSMHRPPFRHVPPQPRKPEDCAGVTGENSGEAASLQEAPPPGALPKSMWWGEIWGERRLLAREAPLPPDPSLPKQRLGIGLDFPPDLRAMRVGRVFLFSGLWSRRLTEPPRPANIPGKADSLQEAPPPGPLPKSGWE